MMPILMTCGYCDRGITDPDHNGWRESCKRCNGKGEVAAMGKCFGWAISRGVSDESEF